MFCTNVNIELTLQSRIGDQLIGIKVLIYEMHLHFVLKGQQSYKPAAVFNVNQTKDR